MLRDWIEHNTFLWLVNEDILDEYKGVLSRRGVRPAVLASAISLIRAGAEAVPLVTNTEISPDPGDEPFCACAEAGNADFIMTLNPADFPQYKLRAHVIAPGERIPTTARKRLRPI